MAGIMGVMGIPTEVQANIEDSVINRGMSEVWPTTDVPTSPLWRWAFHEAAQERFGVRWMGAGFVSCGKDVQYTIPSQFNDVLARAAQLYSAALRDPEIVAAISDEPDGKFPFPSEPARYSIPSS